MPTPALPAAFAEAIAAAFPPDFLTRDPADLLEYGRDWTRAHEPDPAAVALPRTTEEVARLLKLCRAYDVKVVPSGGRTGLAGGAVAARGELVLSLSRMNHMEPVDPVALTVRVQAGAVTQAVHAHCEPHGLTWPIDLAAKGSCQVGGNIATNAGGVKVIRYGLTRQWVLGLQVVTADGEVLELNGALEKNNTGCDLRQLFIGSEGTLGIVTEATLKLARLPEQLDVFLFQVADLDAVLRLFERARRAPFTLMAYEFLTERCLRLVTEHRGLRSPFGALPPEPLEAAATAGAATGRTCYVLCEVERPRGAPREPLEAWLQDTAIEGLVEDGVLAQNPREAAELWALRESISETLSKTGLVHKNDVALPIAALTPFCAALDAFFGERYAGWDVFVFGHIGDGNLHINVRKPADLDKTEFFAHAKNVDHALFQIVRAHHGSVSAEHGIGLLKKDYLGYTRTPAELALLKAVKRALDPSCILNPGKIFDL